MSHTQPMSDDLLEGLTRQFLAMRQGGDEATVVDVSGQVQASVSLSGRLERVVVSPRWQDRVDDEDLAGIVLETISRAQFGAMELPDDEALAAVSDADVEAGVEEALARATEQLLRPRSEEERQARIDALPALFASMDADLARMDRALDRLEGSLDADAVEDIEPEGDEFRSENSMVTVIAKDGFVVDVAIHANWLRGKSGIAVTECLDQIIEQINDQQPAGDE